MLDTRNFDNPRDKSVQAVCVVRALLAAAGLGKRGCRKKKITPPGEKIARTQVKIIGKTSRGSAGIFANTQGKKKYYNTPCAGVFPRRKFGRVAKKCKVIAHVSAGKIYDVFYLRG